MKNSILLSILLGLLCVGCEDSTKSPSNIVEVEDYIPNNITNRFQVVSIQRIRTSGPVANPRIIILKDTEGSNDFMIVSDNTGIAIQPISKPVKQAEDWKK